jgi:hypothetical protein
VNERLRVYGDQPNLPSARDCLVEFLNGVDCYVFDLLLGLLLFGWGLYGNVFRERVKLQLDEQISELFMIGLFYLERVQVKVDG